MGKINFTKIATTTLLINIVLVPLGIFQQILDINLFGVVAENFAWAILLSYASFSILSFLIALTNEISGIKKALQKLSKKL